MTVQIFKACLLDKRQQVQQSTIPVLLPHAPPAAGELFPQERRNRIGSHTGEPQRINNRPYAGPTEGNPHCHIGSHLSWALSGSREREASFLRITQQSLGRTHLLSQAGVERKGQRCRVSSQLWERSVSPWGLERKSPAPQWTKLPNCERCHVSFCPLSR